MTYKDVFISWDHFCNTLNQVTPVTPVRACFTLPPFNGYDLPSLQVTGYDSGIWMGGETDWLGFPPARTNSIAFKIWMEVTRNTTDHQRDGKIQTKPLILISLSMWDRPLGFPPARNQVSSTSGLPVCGASLSLVGDRRRTSQLIGWDTEYTRSSWKHI